MEETRRSSRRKALEVHLWVEETRESSGPSPGVVHQTPGTVLELHLWVEETRRYSHRQVLEAHLWVEETRRSSDLVRRVPDWRRIRVAANVPSHIRRAQGLKRS